MWATDRIVCARAKYIDTYRTQTTKERNNETTKKRVMYTLLLCVLLLFLQINRNESARDGRRYISSDGYRHLISGIIFVGAVIN